MNLAFSPVLRWATAVSLAAHTVLGCCWHHAHAGSAAGQPPAGCAHFCHHHASAEHSGHEDPPAGDPHRHRGACDHGRCLSVPGARTVVEAPGSAPSPAPCDVSAELPCRAGRPTGPEDVAVWHDLPPPVRRHLAKLVLLI